MKKRTAERLLPWTRNTIWRRSAAARNLSAQTDPAPSRDLSVEPLETRLLLSAPPVLVYNFDEGSGFTVHDTAPDGSANDGTLLDDGGVPPEFRSGDGPLGAGNSYLHFGDESSGYAPYVGGRVVTDQSLQPILGGSGTLAFYVRTQQLGSGLAWQSPGITGSDHLGDGNDVAWGNLTDSGGMRLVAGDGAEAITPPVVNTGWRHVVQTRDANTGDLRIYLEGRLVATAAGVTGVKTSPVNSIGANTINAFSPEGTPYYYYFGGDLDQVELYDYAMSPTDVAARYGPHGGLPHAPTVTGDNSIVRTARLTWLDQGDAAGYTVERAPSAAGPWQDLGLVPLQGDPFSLQSFKDPNLVAGQAYFYRVTAFNGVGRSTSPVVQVIPANTGHGVLAHYWDSQFWGSDNRTGDFYGGWYVNAPPDQTVAVGHNVNYDWQDRAPLDPFTGDVKADLFSTAFSGKIHADESGEYWFMSRSDDDGILYVNGQIVSSDPFSHGLKDSFNLAPVTLEEGHDYEFLFLQAEQGGAAAAQMKWMKPSFQYTGQWWEDVPVESLIADNDPPAAPTGLFVQGSDGQSFTFNFTDNTNNEWGYVLERRAPGGTFEPLRKGAIAGYDPFVTGTVVNPVFTDAPVQGGTYEYRVRAYNAEGSAVSNVVTVSAAGAGIAPAPGAQAFYINDPGWGSGARPVNGALPAVGPRADFTQVVNPINFDYDYGQPIDGIGPDFFSTVFTGKLRSEEAGTYQIFLESDDSGYLFVNGQLVSADAGTHGVRDPRAVADGVQRVFPITLAAHTDYNFVALQQDHFNGAAIVMKWVRPGGADADAEVVPEANLVSNIPSAPGGTAAGAPLGPGGLGGSDADSGADFLTLRWTDSATNELRYVVERSTNPGMTNSTVVPIPINSTSYSDVGLTPGTTYYYRLYAENFYGLAMAGLVVTTPTVNRAPAAPQDLRGVARAAGVKLSFRDGSNNEDQFVIERADAGSTSFAAVGTLPGNRRGSTGATLAFTDATVATGHDYVYRVRATNSGGSSPSSNEFAVRAGSPGGTGADGTWYNEQFFTGTQVSVTDQPADRMFFFGESPIPGIDPDYYSAVFHAELQPEFTESYTFYTASDDGIELTLYDRDTGALLLTGPAGGLQFTRGMPLTGFQETVGTASLTAGRRYLLEWRFSQGNGASGYRLGWSSPSTKQEVLPTELLFPVDRATVPLLPVENLAASAFGTESVTVRWTEHNFGEVGFRVERKLASEPDGAFAEVGVADADATSFTDASGFILGQTYVYRVTAVSGARSGAPAAAEVTPGSTGGFTYNGDAQLQPGPDEDFAQAGDNVVLLTPASAAASAGSAFTNNAVPIVTHGVQSLFGGGRIHGFTAQFDFAYPNGGAWGGEGLAFVIQANGPDALGRGGQEAGYGGIDHSFAVGFHPAYNGNFTFVNGEMFAYGQGELPIFFGYGTTRVELEYSAIEMKLTQRMTQLDESGQPIATWQREFFTALAPGEFGQEEVSPLDIPALTGTQYGFFGFSAAGTQVRQTVSNFFLNGTPVAFQSPGSPPPPVIPPAPNAAPTANAGGPYTIVEGQSLTLDASGSVDPDGDELLYLWDLNGDGAFGDAKGVNPTVDRFWLQFYGIDDGPSALSIALRVTDGEAASDAGSTLTLENGAPQSVFGVTSNTLAEGGSTTFFFDFSQTVDPSYTDQNAGFDWSYAVDWNRDGLFTPDEVLAGQHGSFADVTFPDNGLFSVRGRVTDKDGGYSDYFETVGVANADPVAGAIAAPSTAQRVNTDVSVSVPFTDAGSADTHTAVWDWGDGSASAGTVSNYTASGTHRYATPGLYTVSVVVTDDDGGTSFSDYRYVVVYDPNSPGVSGSGWLNTPAGRATFAFDVRYKKNATTPGGNVSFELTGMKFKSTALDWEVVTAGGTTYVRGHGTVNGQAGYSFLLAVVDTGTRRGAGPDRLRMRIWNDTTGLNVFDNQDDYRDDADPLATLGGGNILLG